ncbi:probable D-lactate dehydrogenase, mitochondrial [Oppia nitens]|uniref:probable D-lactate dehydrogenase, mitochondrial n=1 Tax=Oppia nitens TaxID=1686743 RepID=UPI0023DBBF71|nr:probable D-lactate dehydrogenase, mitochondrial [Oppia nitens]
MFIIKNNLLLKRLQLCQQIKTINRKLTNNTKNEILVKRLQSVCGDNNVSTNVSVREQHGKDEGFYPTIPPDVVVFVSNTQHVSDVHKICYEMNAPIIPYGSGTGLEGGVNAINGGVCIDLKNMNKVIEVNKEDFDCVVEAGIDWRSLNEYLRDTGLFFPIDPGASASIGGMAATCASGTNAVLYGTMKENILNLEVVLPNGDIINTSGRKCRSRKSSAGYDLTSLFIGSEGTLGTITHISLRLSAAPDCVAAVVCSFPDDKVAINSVIEILQSNISVARVEYLDDVSIKACRSYSKVSLQETPTLFLEFNGSNDDEVNQRIAMVRDIVVSNGGSNFNCSTDAEERKKLWKARHELYYAVKAMKPNSTAIITDVCVPISRLTEMIVRTKQLIASNEVTGPMFGHVGDGNFHTVIVFDPNDSQELARVKSTAYTMGEIALELGGTCTGEHGIGRGKVQLMRQQYDSVAIDLMKRLRATIDPKDLMNPQKLF